MTLSELWRETLLRIDESPLLHGAISTGIVLAIVAIVLGLLACTTYCLKQFFKRHSWVDRAHRAMVYILTMFGVLILAAAGILGVILPAIPGLIFVLFALLLLRKYHTNRWMDSKIRYLSWKLRFKRGVRKVRRRLHHLGKSLRRPHGAPMNGGTHARAHGKGFQRRRR